MVPDLGTGTGVQWVGGQIMENGGKCPTGRPWSQDPSPALGVTLVRGTETHWLPHPKVGRFDIWENVTVPEENEVDRIIWCISGRGHLYYKEHPKA